MKDYPKIKTLQEFYTFLREHNALAAYKQTFFHFYKSGSWETQVSKYSSPLELMNYKGCSELINSAFLWKRTKQGHAYWSHLEDSWIADH